MSATTDTLPHNVEHEASLLGSMLVTNDIIDMVADRLAPADFYASIHGDIFERAVAIYSKSGMVNPPSLVPYFKEDERIVQLGGVGYLAQLTGQVDYMAMGNCAALANEIAALARRRRIITGMREAAEAAGDLDREVSEAVGLADAAVEERGNDSVVEATGAECFDEMLDAYGREERGVTCGSIPSLDHVMGHALPGQLIIVGARPGMGKTALALSYSIGAARKGHGTLFVSLEMRKRELAQRMASDLCYDGHEIPYAQIRDGRLDGDQRRKVEQARDLMRSLPFGVIDAGSLTIGRLAAMIRRTKRRMAAQGSSLDLVVVDYLQLLRANETRGKSQYEQVSEISRTLKAIAKETGVAIMALAQLSREVEKRPDKRPMLSDLRDSGQIEQDADLVLFLFREEYYLSKEKPPQHNEKYTDWQGAIADARGKIDFIVAKRRNGVEGTATGRFHGEFQAVRG